MKSVPIKKAVLSIIVSALLALVCAGCAGGQGSSSASSQADNSAQSASSAATEGQASMASSSQSEQVSSAAASASSSDSAVSQSSSSSASSGNNAESGASSSGGAAQETSASGKTLVVCWSQTGNTRPLAEYVADITSADFYEIQAEEPYTEADLNYSDSSTRATVEQQQTPEVRPAIAGDLPDMTQYDTVFIAHPIWWGKAPRIVLTFLESVDLSGKTVVEFVTSGSSGISGAEAEVHAAAPGANWLEGRRFDTGTSREAMEEWVTSLGIS